jgi:hypothetical protein
VRKKQIKERRKKKKIYAFYNPSQCNNALRLVQNRTERNTKRKKGKKEETKKKEKKRFLISLSFKFQLK